MIKITVKQLQELHACPEGIAWFLAQKRTKLKTLIPALIKDEHFDYARWLLSQLLTKEQNQLWAINSAKLVLPIFKKKCPNDNRPKKAIEMAEKFLKGLCSIGELQEARNTAYAAANAAYAAYAANAAYAAAYAAANAAYAAYAADAAYAAYAAAYAAYAAAYAAADNAAYAAAYAAPDAYKVKMQNKTCTFALQLLGEIK